MQTHQSRLVARCRPSYGNAALDVTANDTIEEIRADLEYVDEIADREAVSFYRKLRQRKRQQRLRERESKGCEGEVRGQREATVSIYSQEEARPREIEVRQARVSTGLFFI